MTTAPALVRDFVRQGMQVEETHISWVFLARDSAYKVKRPVTFGFLDYGSLEKRRLACEKEVELNRRLAPGVYLGVLPIVLDPQGSHRLGAAGEPGAAVEWAVHMVRQPAEKRGDRLLAQGLLTAGQLEMLAGRLAGFHAAGRCDAWTAGFGSPEAVLRNVEDNLAQARAILERVLSSEEAARLAAAQAGFARALAPLFADRVRQGRVRDGHGDLRLSQMYFDSPGVEGPGGVAVLDCIEFDDRYRFADVCSDVAYLAMDLAQRGRNDLAEAFLAAYAQASGDYDLYRLVDFYSSYRACIRGKVAGYAALDPEAQPAARAAAAGKAGAYYRFALERLACLERPSTPAPLIAFGGGIGTGKSTLASALGRRLAAPVLVSDRIRKQMAGLDPQAPSRDALWSGLYSPEQSGRVYAELRRLALAILASGRPVIVDASFRTRAEREALREAARRAGHPCFFFACRADAGLIRERLAARAAGPSVSDGRAEIAEAFRSTFETDEGSPGDTREIDTGRPVADCLAEVLRAIGAG